MTCVTTALLKQRFNINCSLQICLLENKNPRNSHNPHDLWEFPTHLIEECKQSLLNL